MIFKCNYHFTSHPSIFRTNLISKLRGCVYPNEKPEFKECDIYKLNLKHTKHEEYKLAKERCLSDFKISEKEYMRLYMWFYNLTAQIKPACFKYVFSERFKSWRN
jgi:hypothetical protein